MERKTPQEIETLMYGCFQNPNHPETAYIVYDKHYVVAGSDNPPRYDYIQEHNIDMFHITTAGGTIVVSEGDIGIGIFDDVDVVNSYLSNLKESVVSYLRELNLNVTDEDNDILIDGFKVASYSSKAINGSRYAFGVFQFSVNVDLELINNICTKPMRKIPKGLSEYGITTDEIIENIVLYNL